MMSKKPQLLRQIEKLEIQLKEAKRQNRILVQKLQDEVSSRNAAEERLFEFAQSGLDLKAKAKQDKEKEAAAKQQKQQQASDWGAELQRMSAELEQKFAAKNLEKEYKQFDLLRAKEAELQRVLRETISLRQYKEEADDRIAHLLDANRRLQLLLRFGDGTKQRMFAYRLLLKHMTVKCFVQKSKFNRRVREITRVLGVVMRDISSALHNVEELQDETELPQSEIESWAVQSKRLVHQRAENSTLTAHLMDLEAVLRGALSQMGNREVRWRMRSESFSDRVAELTRELVALRETLVSRDRRIASLKLGLQQSDDEVNRLKDILKAQQNPFHHLFNYDVQAGAQSPINVKSLGMVDAKEASESPTDRKNEVGASFFERNLEVYKYAASLKGQLHHAHAELQKSKRDLAALQTQFHQRMMHRSPSGSVSPAGHAHGHGHSGHSGHSGQTHAHGAGHHSSQNRSSGGSLSRPRSAVGAGSPSPASSGHSHSQLLAVPAAPGAELSGSGLSPHPPASPSPLRKSGSGEHTLAVPAAAAASSSAAASATSAQAAPLAAAVRTAVAVDEDGELRRSARTAALTRRRSSRQQQQPQPAAGASSEASSAASALDTSAIATAGSGVGSGGAGAGAGSSAPSTPARPPLPQHPAALLRSSVARGRATLNLHDFAAHNPLLRSPSSESGAAAAAAEPPLAPPLASSLNSRESVRVRAEPASPASAPAAPPFTITLPSPPQPAELVAARSASSSSAAAAGDAAAPARGLPAQPPSSAVLPAAAAAASALPPQQSQASGPSDRLPQAKVASASEPPLPSGRSHPRASAAAAAWSTVELPAHRTPRSGKRAQDKNGPAGRVLPMTHSQLVSSILDTNLFAAAAAQPLPDDGDHDRDGADFEEFEAARIRAQSAPARPRHFSPSAQRRLKATALKTRSPYASPPLRRIA